MTKPALPRVMTPGMVAKAWLCSERHVRNLISSGELPSFRAGGKLIRLLGADVEAYECRNGASPGFEADSPSKLDADAIAYIRSNPDKMRGYQLAEKFGVSRATISGIKNGRVWRHVA